MTSHSRSESEINEDLLRPVLETGPRWVATVLASGIIVLAAVGAFSYQLWRGIGVWGINRPVMWALDITNFVFWIGISHAGTLISAILRVTGAEWRRPVTRCSEAITVFALMIGGIIPIMHLGRPQLFYWLVPYPNERGLWPNFRSPLAWDFFAINTYLIGSIIYLYLPLIPDLALLRARARKLRRPIYALLSLGWQGTQLQWDRLEKAVRTMAVIIIMVAVSVHTVVSWDFAMAIQPMWHSTIFGPYFVAGAIFSGIAMLVVVMAIIRRAFALQEYIRPVHFNNLGLLLLTMSLIWFYMTFAEYLTTWYGNEPAEMAIFKSKVSGAYAPLFWTMITCCFVIPVPLLAIKRLRTVTGTTVASLSVIAGMWLERFLIIVPTLSQPRLTFNWGTYRPTWVELTLMAGGLAYFIFLYAIFSKLFPIVAVWEYLETGEGRRGAGRPPASGPPSVERMAEIISVTFHTPEEALEVKRQLERAGFKRDSIAIISPGPLPIGGEETPRSRIGIFAVAGALMGGASGLLLTALTSRSMGLVTGGMPIVAPWPFGIITFELMALGAVAATVARTIFEARLIRRRHSDFDDAIASGKIVLVIDCEDEFSRSEAEKLLRLEGDPTT